jgi:predicted glycoside hydrolase/deacetylase ChbG (UPF0249 family)
MPGEAKILLVNADDFGFTRDVNDGIIEAHTRGILTATTLMANAPAFAHAVDLAREHPTLDIGVHFVLVGGPGQPETVQQLVQALLLRRIDPYAELKPQMERVLASGIRPTHVDTHKHTHLHPAVLEAVARLAQENGVKWVRRPFDFPLTGSPSAIPLSKRLVSRGLRAVRGRFHAILSRFGCQTTDFFAGFQLTGRFHAADLIHLIRNLPAGTTEFMCHPGRCGEELIAARTRLKQSREDELLALTDPRVRAALSEAGVRLSRYAGLEQTIR